MFLSMGYIMIRKQIQLTEEQSNMLKALAAEQMVPVAELIRRSIDLFIRASGRISDEEQRRQALAIIGQFPDPATDLSVEHDRYLVQVFGRKIK